MATWLSNHQPIRKSPRLWVENLWLLESKEPLVVTRTISLRQGLNVVWAREPSNDSASGFASAGHGVGKTSFCLLLRYCLGDDAPAIDELCDKASSGFPKGGVAAKVHLDDEVWIVFRPYGRQAQSCAGIGESLETLLAGSLDGCFDDYLESLDRAFVGRLLSKTLPGRKQVLEWRHLLAWCIRDQKSRFNSFYQWREALGFQRPKKDPPIFVRAVLGLHDQESDRLMVELESLQSRLDDTQSNILDLQRLPAYELTLTERRLKKRLGVVGEISVFRRTVGSSLEELVEELLKMVNCKRLLLEDELQRAENALTLELLVEKELSSDASVREVEFRIAQSIVDNNEVAFEKFTKELAELDSVVGLCRYGNVEYSKCEYIVERRTTSSWSRRVTSQAAVADLAQHKRHLEQARHQESAAKASLATQEAKVKQMRTSLRGLRLKATTALTEETSLSELWDEYLSLVKQRNDNCSTPELMDATNSLAQLVEGVGRLQLDLMVRQRKSSERCDALNALTKTVASRMLLEEGYGAFNPDSDIQPFSLHIGGEAYQVLEVLLGDITALLDSTTSLSSLHPGFIVHDCPREADMSERLYREYFLLALEAEEQLKNDNAVPFQYIVTTTSQPPDVLLNEPYLVLELRPGVEDALLFRRRFVPGLPGI